MPVPCYGRFMIATNDFKRNRYIAVPCFSGMTKTKQKFSRRCPLVCLRTVECPGFTRHRVVFKSEFVWGFLFVFFFLFFLLNSHTVQIHQRWIRGIRWPAGRLAGGRGRTWEGFYGYARIHLCSHYLPLLPLLLLCIIIVIIWYALRAPLRSPKSSPLCRAAPKTSWHVYTHTVSRFAAPVSGIHVVPFVVVVVCTCAPIRRVHFIIGVVRFFFTAIRPDNLTIFVFFR